MRRLFLFGDSRLPVIIKKFMEEKEDKGHDNLINDLEKLFEEAKNYAYHDFKNKEHALPKMVLKSILLDLADNVVEGRYDN